MALPQPEDVVEISYLSPTFAPANWSESDRWAFSDHPRSHLILSPKTVFKAEVPIFLGQEMNRTRNLDCRDGLVIVPLLSRDEDPLISICYHPSGAGHLEFANLDRKIFDLLQLSPRVVGRQYVTSLHIHNMKFKSIQHFGEAIHRYPQLKTLYISNTEISDFGPPYHKSIQRSLLERIDSPPRLLGLHDSEGLSSPGSILTIYWMLASPGEISLESLTIVDSAPAYKLLSASSRTLVRTCVTVGLNMAPPSFNVFESLNSLDMHIDKGPTMANVVVMLGTINKKLRRLKLRFKSPAQVVNPTEDFYPLQELSLSLIRFRDRTAQEPLDIEMFMFSREAELYAWKSLAHLRGHPFVLVQRLDAE